MGGTAEIEQAFAGGPDVTSAQWYFDEEPGTQLRFRDLYYWAGAEYHLGLALGMNVGLKSYMDTRVAANIFRILPTADKQSVGVKLLRNVLMGNPFNPEIWYRLAEQTPNAIQGLALCEAALKGDTSLLADAPGNLSPEMHGKGEASAQYWRTLAQFVPLYSLLSHPTPQGEDVMRQAYAFLKTVPGVSAYDLLAYAEKFAVNRPADSGTNALEYDQHLASTGDAYGQLRLGQRYRDGESVPPNEAKAREYFAQAASQGETTAAFLLGSLNPALPPDMIAVAASSVYAPEQAARHLVDGAGMLGAAHDNEGVARTMWHTVGKPVAQPPAPGLAPSPAWARFDFIRPMKFDSILIWNHYQTNYTDRGFRKTRIYGSPDGVTWIPLTAQGVIQLPRAGGSPFALPTTIPNEAAARPFKAVIIAAEATGGNYGSDYYGLSAVRFAVHPLTRVLPAKSVTVTASSVYSPMQAAEHLVDGAGMLGALHDNDGAAQTMWQSGSRPAARPPAVGLTPSPAWVRFDFVRPQQVDMLLLWNHNQANLTDRGLRKVRIYGSEDGVTWQPLTAAQIVELPRASGAPLAEPTGIVNDRAEHPFKAILIAAEATDGNYGGNCFGLSAVRFVIRP